MNSSQHPGLTPSNDYTLLGIILSPLMGYTMGPPPGTGAGDMHQTFSET